jgi:hypothetical protein
LIIPKLLVLATARSSAAAEAEQCNAHAARCGSLESARDLTKAGDREQWLLPLAGSATSFDNLLGTAGCRRQLEARLGPTLPSGIF